MATEQKISLSTAVVIGMNAMIGAGIFSIPVMLGGSVGPAGILTMLLVVVAVWFMALSLSRVAKHVPEEGSFYAYAAAWGGHYVGMCAAGSYLIGLLIAMGLLAQIASGYLYAYFPGISAEWLGVILLATLTLVNMFGVVLSTMGQRILICTTTFPLIAVTILCFSHANIANLTPFAPFGYFNIIQASRIVLFAFFGFECAASLYPIIKNPEKAVPRALTLSITLVGILYIAFASSIILSVPLNLFSDHTVPLPTILYNLFPGNKWILDIVHLSILSAIIGTIHSMIWTSSRLLYSLFKRVKTKAIQATLTKNHINEPVCVMIVGLCITSSYLTLHNVNLFFDLTAVFIVLAYILSMITLLTIKPRGQILDTIVFVIGLVTALTIFLFALEGIQSQIYVFISH